MSPTEQQFAVPEGQSGSWFPCLQSWPRLKRPAWIGSTFSLSGTQSEGRRSKFIYSSKQSLVSDIHYYHHHPDPCADQSEGAKGGDKKKKNMVVKGHMLSSYLSITLKPNDIRKKPEHDRQCSESELDAESAIMCERCNRSGNA